jgi:hypothetical protein
MKKTVVMFCCLLVPFCALAQQGEYGRILANGKWGLINNAGKVLLEPKYDLIYNLKNGVTVAVLNGKRAYVDANGKILTPFSFDKAYHFFNDLALVQQGGKFGLLNKAGKLVVDFTLKSADNFGRFTVAESETEPGRLVLNAAGETIARVDSCYDYGAKDTLIAMKNGKFGVIDLKGREVIPFDYISIQRAGGGFHVARVDMAKTAVLDKTGSVIYESSGLPIVGYNHGLALVYDKQKRMYGAIDIAGNEIFAAEYAFISMDDFGSVAARSGKWGNSTIVLLNLNTGAKTSLECNSLSFFDDNGLAIMSARNGKAGVVDRDEKIIVDPQFDFISAYSEELAAVRVGDKWGYIDTKGKVAVQPQFDLAWGFSEGLAVVRVGPVEGGKRGYIDKNGKFVIQPQFDWAYSFSNGMAYVAFGEFNTGTFGYIDKRGKYLWKPSH